jgi:hypothetical protein
MPFPALPLLQEMLGKIVSLPSVPVMSDNNGDTVASVV